MSDQIQDWWRQFALDAKTLSPNTTFDLNYVAKFVALLTKLDGDGLPPPTMDMLERNEQRVAAVVCQACPMTIVRWEALSEAQRIPYLEATIVKLAGEKEAEQQTGGDDRYGHISEIEEPISENETKLMRALYKRRPALVKQEDLVVATTLDRKTVGSSLTRLRNIGYTHRPNGVRSGETLTAIGIRVIERIMAAENPR